MRGCRLHFWLLALMLGVPAHMSGARAGSNQQVDSRLLEFYAGSPSGCGDARQALHISIDGGTTAVLSSYESDYASIVSRPGDAAMTFLLGPAGCRIGVAIGKNIPRAVPGPAIAGAEPAWTPVPREADRRTFTQSHYANNPACRSAKLYLHVAGSTVLLSITSEVTDEPYSDRTDDGFVAPTGPFRITIGHRGCEIGLHVFRAD